VTVAGKRDKGKAARRRAQMERLAAPSGAGSGAGDDRRSRARDEAARTAAAGPSAARWLVPASPGDAAGSALAVDVVADLLVLDPRTSLRGRGGDALRGLAGRVADLIALGAVTTSGRPLADVVVADPTTRVQLGPTFDLDALLGDGPVPSDRHDRTVRVAEALLERAAAHRDGSVDLHAEVAPVGSERHARADEIETVVRVATDGLLLPAGPEPAIVVATGGWVGVGPVELFLAAGRGLLTGEARDVGGAALATWLERAARDPADTWWGALQARLQVEPAPLLEAAAARAGSDHPDVVGAAVVDLIALRYPVAPPS
jgi:hypothetical protein